MNGLRVSSSLRSAWSASPSARRAQYRCWVEEFESRAVPTANLLAINDFAVPLNRTLLVPLTLSGPAAGRVSYFVESSNPAVSAQVISGGRTWQLEVTGKDASDQVFSGKLTLRLFEDLAPLATQRIIELTNQGFYNGLTFHRVLDGFVAQGGDPNGDGTGDSSLPDFDDEFTVGLTFNSPGLLAFANAGDDNNNSQFFITDIDVPLAGMPQHLNFNHTIFGQLTSGFDTFNRLMSTKVSGPAGKPLSPVTITSASIIDDPVNGVLRITSTGGFLGSTTLTVRADDGTGLSAPETFNVTYVPSTINDRPFLGAFSRLETAVNTPFSFTIPVISTDNDPLTYAVADPNDPTLTTPPANVTISIDPLTGRVDVVPATDFVGTVELRIGVRDQVARDALPLSSPKQFDTQRVTLTVGRQTRVELSGGTPQPSTFGQPVTFQVTVDSDPGTIPAGQVILRSDGQEVGSAQLVNGAATITTTLIPIGTRTLTAEFIPNGLGVGGPFVSATSGMVLHTVLARDPNALRPLSMGLSVTAAEPGQAPLVRVFNPDGSERLAFLAYDASFFGGVRAMVGDVNGDGVPDIVVVPRFGGSPWLKVFRSDNGAEILSLMVFEESFRGGLYLDLGDFRNVGYAQVLVGAGDSGGPRVTIFDVRTRSVVANYFAYDMTLRGGVSVAAGDLNGDGILEVITGAGRGGAPVVTIFRGEQTLPDGALTAWGSFLAGEQNNREGIRVAVGEPGSNGVRIIRTGSFVGDEKSFDQGEFDPTLFGIFVGS